MEKIYALISLCFCVVSSLQAQTTIYAYRNWQQSNPVNVQKGPVKFSSDNLGVVELIADQSTLGAVYAGTYFNYKWYAQVTKPGTQSSLEGLYTVDMNDGTRTLISTNGVHLVEMTYDYTTNTMYGIKNGAEYLMTLDLNTGETKQIGAFQTSTMSVYMLALACHVDGTMYGISTDDNLYRIDKATAACTLIGATGVNAAFTQSMDFDRNTGILYWLNCGDYKLYTVDITTGAATVIGGVGKNGDDSMASMFIPYIHVPVGAPDRVLDRKVVASGNSAILSWRNPSFDAQGKALTELTGIKIYRGEELVTTVTVSSDKTGQSMEYTDENLQDGLYSYRFVPVNSKGDGGVDSDDVSTYVGENAPGKVVDFVVKQGDNEAILTWKAPGEGMYGDYLYIFDGADTNAPLIGEFTSTSVPSALVSLESTSIDGALTFVFYSDVMSRDEGWDADVTVTEKKTHDLMAVSLKGDLYPGAESETIYAFTIRNKGVDKVAATDYKVKLLDAAGSVLAEMDGVEIGTMQSIVFDMKFTPSESGDIKIHAEIEYAGDDDKTNNSSEELSVSVLEEGSQFISIGDHDEEISVLPVSFMTGESIGETIYYKDEVGLKSGTLQMISYRFSSVGTSYSNIPVKIWVGETELEDLSETSIPADEMTLVFDGTASVTPGDEEWIFQLTTPYSYKGGNLVILILKGNQGSTSYDISFKGTYGSYDSDPQRSRFYSAFDDSEVLDPNAVPIGYSGSTMWPDVKMLFTDASSGITKVVDDLSVRIYPNPVSDILYVEGVDVQKIEIFDGTGRQVYVSDNLFTVDMSSYPIGIYYLRVVTNQGKVSTKKIMKR